MSLEAFQINGKNAPVTGSHRGLGAAIAVALAKAGANVGCHGRDPNPGAACDEVRAAGRKTFYFFADNDAGWRLAHRVDAKTLSNRDRRRMRAAMEQTNKYVKVAKAKAQAETNVVAMQW